MVQIYTDLYNEKQAMSGFICIKWNNNFIDLPIFLIRKHRHKDNIVATRLI
jgi:hypothetical protein